MAEIYLCGKVWYAPAWRNPRSGIVLRAHSLSTRDEKEAEAAWILEQARELDAYAPQKKQLSIAATRRGDTLLSELFDLYLATKKMEIKPDTYAAYLKYRKYLLLRLGDLPVARFAPPEGTLLLLNWSNAEIDRLKGRKHTVKKRLEALLKPALKMAARQKMISGLPDFPGVSSDYNANGRREFSLTPDEFAALRNALPEKIVHEGWKRCWGKMLVYPRLWADLAVSTGLHEADLHRFVGDLPMTPGGRPVPHWRRLGRQWYRVNSKGADYYPPVYLPCDPYLTEVLERAYRAREWKPGELLVASAPPPKSFMRRHLERAAKKIGLPVVPSSIDFRHTFACWRRDAGWEFDETARWLGNSSGMVRKVYAQIPSRQLTEVAERARPMSEQLLRKIDGEEAVTLEKQPETLADIVQFGGKNPGKKAP